MHPLLQTLVETHTVPNTLLFCGVDTTEMLTASRKLALALMGPAHSLKIEKGIHPDLQLYSPQGKVGMHAIETMRQLISEVSLPPFEAPVRLFVIEEAHRMLPTGSNALLKTLEEPTPHTIIILITQEPKSLLPTIVSRARRIDFRKQSTLSPLNPLLYQLLARPLSYADRLTLFEELETQIEALEEGHERAQAQEALLEQILTWARDQHLILSGADRQFLSYPELCTNSFNPQGLPPWDHLITLVEKCRLGLHRSMKLRVVLEYLFLSI